jgi:hypothetical protein
LDLTEEQLVDHRGERWPGFAVLGRRVLGVHDLGRAPFFVQCVTLGDGCPDRD